MDEHGKKMIAPIVITILMVAYYIFYFGVLLSVIPLMADFCHRSDGCQVIVWYYSGFTDRCNDICLCTKNS